MKAKLLFITLLLSATLQAPGREFKKADGSESLEAEFMRYAARTGQVTLRLPNRRNMLAMATDFSKEDVDYILEMQRLAEAKRALRIEMDEDSDDTDTKRGQLLYEIEKTNSSFKVRNSSDLTLKDLDLTYWVAIERDNKGEEKIEVVKGTTKIPSLESRSTINVKGPAFDLVQGAVSDCKTGCPKVAARAAQIGRDKALGTKIEVCDASGEVLYSDYTSGRAQRYFEEISDSE
jgi:hypothetical protein